MLLFDLLFFVLFLALSAVAFVLLSRCLFLALSLAPIAARGGLRSCVGTPRVRRSCGLSSRTSSTALSSISMWFGIIAVFAVFHVLRGARQVERFAACVFGAFAASCFPS